MFGMHQEKEKRTTDDIIIMLSDAEEFFRKKFILENIDVSNWKCTICAKITNDKPYPHPALRVSICFDCLKDYGNAVFLTNKDGTDKNCRWCAQPAKKYCCSSCTVIFCKICLEHNFGADYIRSRVAGVSDWKCFICDSKPLWRLRVECSKAMEKRTNNIEKECEVIDLLSQDSQEDCLSTSQLALANCSEEVISEIISPTKPSQSSAASDQTDTCILTQQKQEPDLKNESNKQDFSAEEKQSLFNLFEESEKDMSEFHDIFSMRLEQYSRRIKNINSFQEAEKLINKFSTFCDNAIVNIQCIKNDGQDRYKQWHDSVNKQDKRLSQICDKEPSIETTTTPANKKPESKILDSTPSTSRIDVPIVPQTEPNKECDKRKTKAKRKRSLSLKTPVKELPKRSISDDTVALLEHIKKTIPDDEISPSQYSLSLLNHDKKTPPTPEILSPPISIIEDNASDQNVAESNKSDTNLTEISTKSTSTNINVAKTRTSSPTKSIKTEIKIEAEQNSIYSEETIIRNESVDVEKEETVLEQKTVDGEKELMKRIREDFEDEDPANNVCVRIENYLCEKTGSFCCNYRTGKESPVSEISYPPFEFSDKESDSDSSATDIVDWGDLIDLTKQTTRDVEEDDLTNIHFEEIIIKQEIKTEDEDVIKCHYSSSDTESDSSEVRQAALKALMSDTSSLSSVSSSSSISTDSDSDNEDNHRPPIPWEPPGHVLELSIKNELAKLQGNYDQSYSTTDLETFEDQKLLAEPVVQLNDYKLKLKPVVVIEKIDFDNCYGLTKNGKKYSISNSEDSEDEIRRLTDLSSLKKRSLTSSSSDNDSDEQSLVKRKKKRIKKQKNPLSSSSSDTDDSSSSIQSGGSTPNILNTKNVDEDYIPEVPDDIFDTAEESTEDDDEEEVEVKSDKKKKEKSDVEEITDEDSRDKSSGEDPNADWRKDKLLTGNLAIAKDDSETNDSTADEILLKREYEKYVENADNEKPKKTRRPSVQSIDSSDTIVLSTDDDSDNSDIQFVDVKRKRDSDEEGSPKKNKKGRRNIREVLKDSELQEETKKADKEESERKERLTLKQKTLDTLLSETQLSQEEVGFVLEMDEEKKEPIVTVHYTLVRPLKDHQKKGIKFMWDVCFESVSQIKSTKGVGCILAHCMGLGKTMQVVVLVHTLLTHPKTNIKRILVVCPLSTVFNWRNEFVQTIKPCSKKINLFDIRPHKQKTFRQKLFEVRRWHDLGGVLMMGYESFQSLVNEDKLTKFGEDSKKTMLESLIDPGPDVVVCDEGHMLKNGKTLRFISLSKVKTSRRIILTGTPLQNNLLEYYHMVNFVKPHLLGTLDEYKNRFVNPIMNGQYEDSNHVDISLMKKRSHILHKKLETTVQRYEESELAPYLPERHDYVLFFQLTPLQIILYEHYLALLDANTKKLFRNYHALQNIWTHPALLKIKYDKRKDPPPKKQRIYDEDYVEGWDPDKDIDALNTDWFKDILPEDVLTNMSYGIKIEVLFSVIKECEAIEEKLLVFSSSIDELDLIEYFLNRRSWVKDSHYYRMDGAVPPDKRSFFCNEFNNQNNTTARLFLVSHKVGGLGLNLTAASRVVLMDVNWNPAYDTQSVFRVYRFGQTKNCYIYRFVSLGTMEEVVYSRAVTKLAISCRVVDEHQIKRHFNEDDLQRMYSLNKDFGEPHTPTLPSDRLLAKLWETHKPQLFKFCDHQSLLENLAHEELNEEEMNSAWEEFRNEVDREKQAKDLAAQMRLQSNFIPQTNFNPQMNNSYNGAMPMGPNMPAGPSRFALPPRLPHIKAIDPVSASYRYKRPNALPIPVSTNHQQHQEFLRKIYPNFNFQPVTTSSNSVASTSVGPVPSTSNILNPFTGNRTYGSNAQNNTALNLSNNLSTSNSFNGKPTYVSSTQNNTLNSSNTLSTSNSINGRSSYVSSTQNNTLNSSNTLSTSNSINGRPSYGSSIQNNTLNSSSATNSAIGNNPFLGNPRKGKAIIRNPGYNFNMNNLSNLNNSTGYVQIIPPNNTVNGQKENVFQRAIETLNSNGVSVLPESDKSKNFVEP